jgi:hypothetical protein
MTKAVRRCLCGQETRMSRSPYCEECWLSKQPTVVRIAAAEARLALMPEEWRRSRVPEKDWPPGRRFCAGCQTFVRIKDSNKSRCKTCDSIASHKSRIKSVYGITDADYQWLLDLQLGKCAICGNYPYRTRLAIDHNHHCKECDGSGCRACVRGLLCKVKCNRELLGAAKHDVKILRNAVAYMENPPFQGNWSPPQEWLDAWEAEHPGEPPPPY